MSTKSEPVNWSGAGWAFLGLLSLFAWLATMVGQFVGVAWYWPWVFMTLFWFLVVKTSKTRADDKKREENKPRFNTFEDYKMPHLVSVPGQYTRKPCDNPDWITIRRYPDYQINCATHEVRNRHTGNIVEHGRDPYGKDDRVWLDLGFEDGHIHYVHLDWVVETTLGKGHSA